ncbi:MAG: hypothetical protein L6W00_19035 [Lentisphaeria bacterium]|nr:MAG: hypothetical protein L6W00_19035 [Lentisphaeria bacterium]
MKTIHFFIIVFVGAVLGFLPLRTAGATSLFRLEDQGNFQLDSMRFGWILYPPGWNAILLDRNSFRIDAGFPHRREGRFEVKGNGPDFTLPFPPRNSGTVFNIEPHFMPIRRLTPRPSR